MEFSKLTFLLFGLIALSKSKPTQDDIQIEVKELLNQYRATDATIAALQVDCPCTKATECKRISELLTKAKKLPRNHPERNEAITYLKNLTCDKENQKGLRCCPEPTTTTTLWEPTSFGDKDSGTWKPLASKKECGYGLVQQNVLGGGPTEFGSYPFMSLLGKTHGTRVLFTCGASVINKYYILTAAHCFLNGNPSVIALGEHDLKKPSDGVIHRGVEKIIHHEDYDRDFQGGAGPNDIALIRVNESIPLFDSRNPKKSNVMPICLPWNRWILAEN